MNNYETFIVLDALQTDAVLEAEVNKTAEFIKAAGDLQNVNRWGKRKLAYPIKSKSHGDYTLFSWSSDGKAITPMEKAFSQNENVLRFMTVKVD
ncbi:MAG: 30S ribosomal protein S6 [Fibrobacteres bacterium]|nr:30S ribosomal protein S6 [Fibrobacterota bacterium]